MSTGSERTEGVVQILIFITIGSMAGAASFTHVHDWTMQNSPPGTGGWFGWANAVISELTPTAAGLEIRRRKRHHAPIAYPMAVLVADAILSLSAQVAEATPSFTGWLVAAVPALAFLALAKLILSGAGINSRASNPVASAPADAPDGPSPIPATEPVAATPVPESDTELPSQFLASARMAAFAHRQATGQPITADILATNYGLPYATAEALLRELDGTIPPPVTAANGTPITGSGL